MRAEVRIRLSLIGAILVALGAQYHGALPEPWNHVINIAGIAGTAISGWVLQSPRKPPRRHFFDT